MSSPNNALKITDSESTNLTGATVTIVNPQNGASEFLSATAMGNITIAYDAATNKLTLTGTDTVANYEQVLKSVTYTNNAVSANLTPRSIEFVVNDGASFNNLSPVANTTLTLNLILNGTSGNDTLVGDAGNDSLSGFAGNDSLDGKASNDTLIGGIGNDTYVVDNAGDVVNETSTLATEIDTVQSNLTYTLGANLENLTLTGTSGINGTGNTLNNALTGNTANNSLTGADGLDTLNGSAGLDTMTGGAGNDTYVVDNAGDVVNETSTLATEIDTVQSNLTYTLGANLENLTLTGTSEIGAIGNTLNNSLTGNTASNNLTGAEGNDTLNGQVGNDKLYGLIGDDKLYGQIGNDLLHGGLGNDYLSGFDGLDTLMGNEGNDSLNGGNGDDVLAGGIGTDTLFGGAGSDRFIYDTNASL
ncbi:MAG: calcium-binding protein [Hydrococcus sp. SU_1_0]|nr:calcium-binding protein [Hydrococcus sp. SU_1_0]